MPRISFIVPTWKYFSNPFKLQPLHEMYFATILRNEFPSFLVDITDLRGYRHTINNISMDNFIDSNVGEKDIYIYWISKTADFNEIKQVVNFLRNKYKQSIHIAGGNHVDVFFDECSLFFDAVIKGPAERSLIRIVNDYLSNSLSKKYEDKWELVHYGDYSFPKRDFLPKESIANNELFDKYGGVLGTSVLFSRGCPFRCSYCSYNVPGYLQYKKSEMITDEISYLKKDYGIKAINIRDEICIDNIDTKSTEYLNSIKKCDIIWRGQTRVGIKKHIMKLAKESGCVELVLGVESVIQHVIDAVNKKQTVEQSIETIRMCKEFGIKSRINLILGLPKEPEDIVNRTISFIEEYDPDYVSVSGLCPIPGSDMFEHPSKYGIKVIYKNWNQHAHLMYRFSDDESHGLPFEYDIENNSVKLFSRVEIINNLIHLQKYLREKGKSY